MRTEHLWSVITKNAIASCILSRGVISVISDVWHFTRDWHNSSKNENHSPSFSSFNHEGQLQMRAAAEITTTDATKPSLQRTASSFPFYCLSRSLSVFPLSVFSHCLWLFILLCCLPQSKIMRAGVFFTFYKEKLAVTTCVIYTKQMGMRPAFASQS